MGYILPVNHYQYNDYQTRIMSEKRKGAKQVDRSFKVILEKQHENLRNKYERIHDERSVLSPEMGKGEKFDARV